MSITLPGTYGMATAARGLSVQAAAQPATTPSTSSGTNQTITSGDFMTLLVAEMKNQDPTQPTDPTQYVQQLVQVNSLQQLISINQGVTALKPAA